MFGSLLGTAVLVELLPPGTVMLTLLNVTLLMWLPPDSPHSVAVYCGLLFPVMLMLSYVMLLMCPIPGLLPHRRRVPIITAAYTGMRWGELTGLRRPNCKLDDARIYIDPDDGALHEVGGHLELGSPKTPAAVRDILLPPFLVELLRAHLDTHKHDHVFTGRDGGLHRRSSFHRRHWRPATDGDPDNGIPAIVRGLHFHDLRHSHKTWLIEDGVPRSPRPNGSATGYPACAASTATSAPPSNNVSSTDYKHDGSRPLPHGRRRSGDNLWN